RNICRMIVAGFTGQLRGWWDNYLTIEERAMVINAEATDEGDDNLGMALVANREDVVYTLILTILEHFNGRFTNQNETEGLNLCNELRLSRQLKMDKLKERNQLGDFCTQFGLPETSTHKKKKPPNCKLQKQKTLGLDDELRDKVYGLLYTSGSESDYYSKSESEAEIDLLDLSDSNKNVDDTCTTCKGLDDELRDKVYGLLYTSGSESDYYSESESEAEIDLLDLSDSNKNVDDTCTTCKDNSST
uniref:DUF7746 domain-containing protein n=1 Tax=Nicotiana tabacum TaxID=4097 RepID=A0A1S3YCQ5_TOBAC